MFGTRLYRLIVSLVLVILLLPVSPALGDSPRQGAQLCPAYDPQLARSEVFLGQLPPECRKVYRQNAMPGSVSDVHPLATGGPDEFGYTFDDDVSESWISATINTNLQGDDEASFIDIGFDFRFYGLTYSQVHFNTNGLLTFGDEYYWYGGDPIPLLSAPNNFIAPFWEDLLVGDFYNNGGIYYQRGGSAPHRYLVLEWRNVETYWGSAPFSFEVILHENGDIVFQHQSLPAEYESTVGIENSLGDDGLLYQYGDAGLSAPNVIHIYYPTEPVARILLTPTDAGHFTVAGAEIDFLLTVANTGSLGTDAFNLAVSTDWPYNLYAADGTTPLTDTDADTVVDTGPIDMGESTTIVAEFTAPTDAETGGNNVAALVATSSLDDSKSKTANLAATVPAGFANVFVDQADGSMSFMTANSEGTNIYPASTENPYGSDLAVEKLATGSYFYVWSNSYFNGKTSVSDIEFALVDRNGNVVRPTTKLTNNSRATQYTQDFSPAVAIANDGTIGVVWSRYVYNFSTQKYNYNVYMALLTPAGDLIKQLNITNKTVWGTFTSLNVPAFFDLTIASTAGNRFMIGWRDERQVTPSNWKDNIWYTIRDTAGTSVFPSTAFTDDGASRNPVLSPLNDGKTILTWSNFTGTGPFYAVLNHDGSILQAATVLGDGSYNWSADAVQLPNGKVAVAWAGQDAIQLAILNSSYAIESGPATGYNPAGALAASMSVTTDEASRVIMTWASEYALYYALGDDSAAFLTDPMLYASDTEFSTSNNGQGNAPFRMASSVPPQVASITRVEPDFTKLTAVNFTVTFSEPVSGVDQTDFALTATDVTGAAITKVSGFGATHLVTVNTGKGNGTIRLDVTDNDSIKDEFGNLLGGAGAGNGGFTTGEVFTIVKGAAGVPGLLLPASGATVTGLRPVFDWKDSVPAAHQYQLQVSAAKNFSTTAIDQSALSDSTFTPASDLMPGTQYYWRVRAFNIIGGASAWSKAGTFKTPLEAPVSLAPAGDPFTNRPTFTWDEVDGASQYNLQVSSSDTFNPVLVNVTVSGAEYVPTKDLLPGKTLFWRVAARNKVVTGPWSSTVTFKSGNPPTVPVLAAPANNALLKTYTPLLNWNDVKIPAGTTFKHYELQWAEDQSFTSPHTETTTLGDITDSDFTPLSNLPANSKIYWRVRAVNDVSGDEHTSGWSSVRWFRTVIAAPAGLDVTLNGLKPTFEWDDATGPEPIKGYTIQVSANANFAGFLINATTQASLYEMLKDLPAGKTIYWRVRVNGANGPSEWSKTEFVTP